MKSMSDVVFAAAMCAVLLTSAARSADYVVDTTGDNGLSYPNATPGSLRWAIDEANANPNNPANVPDTISFDITGSGPFVLQVPTVLPPIYEDVVIDGYTQPGAARATTTTPAVIQIELDGSLLGGNPYGMYVMGATGAGTTVCGLSIYCFGDSLPGDGMPSAGVRVETEGAVIEGNWIGLDSEGTPMDCSGMVGVLLTNFDDGMGGLYATTDSLVGGADPSQRNVISGLSMRAGIELHYTSANRIEGNYIGTDPDGNALGLGQVGIWCSDPAAAASNTDIGGTAPGAGNVISGNQDGVIVNGGIGIRLMGNMVGPDADGSASVGNAGCGVVLIDALNCSVGIPASLSPNEIAYNAEGVRVVTSVTDPEGVVISSNMIHSNTGMGIDLADDGVTPNDAGDADTGPSRLQNYPVITSAAVSGGFAAIRGTLDSTASSVFRIEYFSSAVADGSGYGEGATYLGHQDVVTNGAGIATFDFVLPTTLTIGHYVTATATNPNNNTSEFSAAVAVDPGLVIGDVTLAEGDASTTDFVFTVTLPVPATTTVTADWVVADGTAQDETGDGDYVDTSGTVTFDVGDDTEYVTVQVLGDVKYEANETFGVELSNASGAGIVDGTGDGTITNDDGLPVVSISATSSAAEGDSGSSLVEVGVTLSHPSYLPASVQYDTAAGTGDGGGVDYVDVVSGSAVVPAGATSATASVTIIGDRLYEGDEGFLVAISNPTDGTLGSQTQCAVTITDDDAPPAVVSILRADPDPTTSTTVAFTVTFDSGVSGVDATDFVVTVTGTAAASISGVVPVSGTVYTVVVNTVTGDGTLRLDLDDDDSIRDAWTNTLGGPDAQDYITGEVYTIDNTPPSAPVVVGPTVTNDTTPEWTWTTGGGGAGFVRFGYTEGSWIAEDVADVSYAPPAPLAAGVWTLFVQERDGLGQWSASGLCAVEIELTAPVAGVDTLLTNDDAPPLSGTVDDANASVSVTVSSQTHLATNNGDGTWTLADGALTPLDDGVYDVEATATDAAGNVGTDATSNELTIDSSPPSAPVVTGMTPTTIAMPTWSWSTGGGGILTFRYGYLESAWIAEGVTDTDFTPSTDLTPGSHTLYVQERDAAGNWSVSSTLTIVVQSPSDSGSGCSPGGEGGAMQTLLALLCAAAGVRSAAQVSRRRR